jgi:hypothetical protein
VAEATGPVVRDIVEAYYDKKNRKTNGTVTADEHQRFPQTRHRRCPALASNPKYRGREANRGRQRTPNERRSPAHAITIGGCWPSWRHPPSA